MNIPKHIKSLKQGFYLEDGTPCKYADSKQIDKNNYELQHDLYYVALNGEIFHIKKGFIHDGASKWILKRFGRYTNASILHDALYGSNKVSRSKADNLFLEAMEFSKVPYMRRYTYYWTVRGLGWTAYKKSQKEIDIDSKFIKIYTKDKER